MAHVAKWKSGKWRARWRDPDGRTQSKIFDRKQDADTFLTSVRHDILTGAYIDPRAAKTTLDDYYARWSRRQPWRDSTRASTESLFRLHILPTFGRRAIGSIRRGEIEDWAAGLDLAGQTAQLALQKLGAILDGAVADGLIAQNPQRRAVKPRADVAPVVPLTADELDALRDSAPDWFRVSLTLGAAAGLRHSEATGLTVDHVDFMRRSLTVDRQLVTLKGAPAFGPPKTQRSYRTVPLADVALESIAQHIEQHGTGTDGLILHADGTAIRRNRFGQLWRATRKRAGLPGARFHDCRHTFVSTLLSGGVGIAAVAEYAGNTPAVLLKTYAHLIPADHDRARSVVQDAFAKRPGSQPGHAASR